MTVASRDHAQTVRQRGRRAGRVALALVIATTVVGFTPRPSEAADLWTTAANGEMGPITWADDAGRQYTVVLHREYDAPTQLVVGRDTVDGDPDLAWGSLPGHPGFRALTFVKPAAGVNLEPVMTVDSETGILSTVWAACSTTSTCDRWFARYNADGTSAGSAVKVTGVLPMRGGLDDGSFLTGYAPSTYHWYGPTGTDRGALEIAVGDLAASSIDTSGRLLTVTRSGVLTRRAPGSEPDLTKTLDCATAGGVATNFGTDQGIATGPAPGNGFATACGASDPANFVVTRYDDTGAQVWRTTGQVDGYGIISPRQIVVDPAGKAWVSGTTGFQSVGPAHYDLIEPFTAAGAQTGGYKRSKFLFAFTDGGISDLHLSHGLTVFADQQTCCRTGSSQFAAAAPVHSGVLPYRHPRPACAVTELEITEIDGNDLTISFAPCTGVDASANYRIAVSNGAGPVTSVALATGGPKVTADTSFVGSAGGVLGVSVTPYTDAGSSTVPAAVVRTVPPFTSLSAFVQRQYQDLTGSAPGGPVATAVAHLEDGTLTPSTLFDQLLDSGLAHSSVEPVARLYRAYFVRDADLGGLTYWVRKRRAGATLARISSSFAASPEFQRRYGSLTNPAFVAKLYQNVFGRNGDPEGLAFWTRRLDTHRNTRGEVVLQFSESSEGVRRTGPVTQPLAAAFLMLGRKPTAGEQAAWGAVSPSQLHSNTAGQILATEEYADRIS